MKKAESEVIEETIDSIEDRIDRLTKKKADGVESIRYRGEIWDINDVIRDLRDRSKAWQRLNED